MPQPTLIDRAIDAVADGLPVDWDALDSQASAEERALLQDLRLLGGIAEVHRSSWDQGETTEETRAPQPGVDDSTAPTEDRSESWGRYVLTKRVGAGSFGSVYRAWDPELEREIAIKILHSRATDARVKERLLREGRALARVRHPNVVSVFGVEAHGDRVGLCMEFVRGETLEAVLTTHGTLNAREAVLVGEEVCRALAAVHAAGFVHRDVKARNVMRERAGRIVLMDFGTGRHADELKEIGHVGIAGTPLYMAPEVLAELPASESSDVYSVGVLLYHLVTGSYPVEGKSIEELRAAHMQGRRRLLSDRRSDLPMPFVQMVERALSADPAERYLSSGALLEALGQIERRADRRSISRYLQIGGLAVLGTPVLMTGLGILSSRQLNARLGRSEFVTETAWDWFYWGAISCLAPAVLALIVVLAIAMVSVLRHVLLAVSVNARRLENVARLRVARTQRRLHLDDVSVLASWVLLVSTVALLSGWRVFSPLVSSLGQNISTARPDALAILAPDHKWYHDDYRITFTWIVLVSVLAWYAVSKFAASKGEKLNRGLFAGGAVVVLLGLALLDYPYRMLQHNKFAAITWNDADCYLLGERQDDLLLFCPELKPPRNRIVNRQTSLTRTGVTESIFTRFSKQSRTTSGPDSH